MALAEQPLAFPMEALTNSVLQLAVIGVFHSQTIFKKKDGQRPVF